MRQNLFFKQVVQHCKYNTKNGLKRIIIFCIFVKN